MIIIAYIPGEASADAKKLESCRAVQARHCIDSRAAKSIELADKSTLQRAAYHVVVTQEKNEIEAIRKLPGVIIAEPGRPANAPDGYPGYTTGSDGDPVTMRPGRDFERIKIATISAIDGDAKEVTLG